MANEPRYFREEEKTGNTEKEMQEVELCLPGAEDDGRKVTYSRVNFWLKEEGVWLGSRNQGGMFEVRKRGRSKMEDQSRKNKYGGQSALPQETKVTDVCRVRRVVLGLT